MVVIHWQLRINIDGNDGDDINGARGKKLSSGSTRYRISMLIMLFRPQGSRGDLNSVGVVSSQEWQRRRETVQRD